MTPNILVAVTTANNLEYTKKCIHSIDLTKYTVVVFDDASDDETQKWCEEQKIPFISNPTPKGLTSLWNLAYVYFIQHSFDFLVFSNNDVIYSTQSIDLMIGDMVQKDYLVISPLSNKPGASHIQHISNYLKDLNFDDDTKIEEIQQKLPKSGPLSVSRINGFSFIVNRQIQKYANSVDCLFPPQFINVGNEDWLCDEINRVEARKIGVSTNSFVFHYKAVTLRNCGQNREQVWKLKNNKASQRENFIRKTYPQIKPTVLCKADVAMGFGDGVMLFSTISDLLQQYKVRLIATPSVCQIFRKLEHKDFELFDLNSQGRFYQNDHYRAYNLTYWDLRNSLRQFPHHAINMIREFAELEIYQQNMKRELPELNVDITQMLPFIQSLPKPIIITQPFMSYWNKMIDPIKYISIVSKLLKIGTVIQIGSPVPDHMIHPGSINLIGKTTIEQTLSLLKLADVFIGGDSFLQHACATLKTPAVVLFCGTHSYEFGYPFHANLCYDDIAFCQKKCGRPMRWLFDYDYQDPNKWDSRSENGWICPSKLCQRVITVDDVINATSAQLDIGKDRDWSFYDLQYSNWKQDPRWNKYQK